MSSLRFSVIICSIDPWKFAQACVGYQRLLAGYAHEIVGIHDARSLAEGYNRGFRQSSGDIVIFSHDDVIFLDPGFAAKIDERMHSWDLLGFAGSSRLVYPAWHAANWPHLHGAVSHWSPRQPTALSLCIYGVNDWPVIGGIQTMDGLCLIARRDIATAVRFDEDTFDGWHLYDVDFSVNVSHSGYKTGICCDIPYIHASASIRDSNIFDGEIYRKYAERFAAKHADKLQPNYRSARRLHARLQFIRDHDELRRLWSEDIFRRATLALARDAAFRDES
jgi:GT2 family glycosyltransferase